MSDIDYSEETGFKGELKGASGLAGEISFADKTSPDYPEIFVKTLGEKAPDIIFSLGNITLLEKPIVMVCGSRKASENGLETAYKIGWALAKKGYSVISGYARGIDMAAHAGALDSGGSTVAILPYGIMNFRVVSSIAGSFDSERFLAISEMTPDSPFTKPGAFRRNQVMVALSEAVIAVEPGDTGGTWHSIKHAVKMGRPLYYNEGSRADLLKKLEDSGAVKIEMEYGEPLMDGFNKLRLP